MLKMSLKPIAFVEFLCSVTFRFLWGGSERILPAVSCCFRYSSAMPLSKSVMPRRIQGWSLRRHAFLPRTEPVMSQWCSVLKHHEALLI